MTKRTQKSLRESQTKQAASTTEAPSTTNNIARDQCFWASFVNLLWEATEKVSGGPSGWLEDEPKESCGALRDSLHNCPWQFSLFKCTNAGK